MCTRWGARPPVDRWSPGYTADYSWTHSRCPHLTSPCLPQPRTRSPSTPLQNWPLLTSIPPNAPANHHGFLPTLVVPSSLGTPTPLSPAVVCPWMNCRQVIPILRTLSPAKPKGLTCPRRPGTPPLYFSDLSLQPLPSHAPGPAPQSPYFLYQSSCTCFTDFAHSVPPTNTPPQAPTPSLATPSTTSVALPHYPLPSLLRPLRHTIISHTACLILFVFQLPTLKVSENKDFCLFTISLAARIIPGTEIRHRHSPGLRVYLSTHSVPLLLLKPIPQA